METRPDQTENLIRLTQEGKVPHYAFVLDRSPAGQEMLNGMKSGPAQMKARACSEAVRSWEAMPHVEYVVICGTWGRDGGLTFPAADLDALLTEALPAATDQAAEDGGLCGFFAAVSDANRDIVLARIAELQQVEGGLSN